MGGPATLPDRPLPISPKELSWLHGCRQVAVHLGGLSEFASWRPRSYQVSRRRPGPPGRRWALPGRRGGRGSPGGGLRGAGGAEGRRECRGAAGKDGIGVLGCAPGSGAGVEASARGWERVGADFISGFGEEQHDRVLEAAAGSGLRSPGSWGGLFAFWIEQRLARHSSQASREREPQGWVMRTDVSEGEVGGFSCPASPKPPLPSTDTLPTEGLDCSQVSDLPFAPFALGCLMASDPSRWF